MRGRLSLRVVKVLALLLATFGLGALWWTARHTDLPQLTVGEAQGLMNLAYVRMAGRVSRGVTYDPEGGYLSFWLDDGTGEAYVAAYRDVTAALLAEGKIPAVGDQVEVAGTLRLREDFVALTLNLPDHLTVSRPPPVALPAGKITPLDEGLRVRLTGEVVQVTSPYTGLTLISVRDATGEVTVAVDAVVIALSGPLPELAERQGVVVTGTVSLYRGTPQLVPATVKDIAALPLPTPAAVSATPQPTVTATPLPLLSTLSAADEGAWVTVRGRVVALTGLKGGVKATLDDGTAQLTLLLWSNVYAELPERAALDLGAEVEAAGRIALYEGALELVPDTPQDIRVLSAAPPLSWVEIESLTEADVGRIVRLRGVFGVPSTFSAGIKVPCDDGTGALTVLLWSNVAEALPEPPQAGMPVEVIGEVSSYRGELELIPRSAFDVQMASSE